MVTLSLMRKSVQDRVFDKTMKLLPSLGNDDLIAIVVTCNQLMQGRQRMKQNVLNQRKPPATRQTREGATENAELLSHAEANDGTQVL